MNGSARVEEGRSVEVSTRQVILKGNLVEPERSGSVCCSPMVVEVADSAHEIYMLRKYSMKLDLGPC